MLIQTLITAAAEMWRGDEELPLDSEYLRGQIELIRESTGTLTGDSDMDREMIRSMIEAEIMQINGESPVLYALVSGGVVQEASPEIQVVDVDWMEHDEDNMTTEEIERQYVALRGVPEVHELRAAMAVILAERRAIQ